MQVDIGQERGCCYVRNLRPLLIHGSYLADLSNCSTTTKVSRIQEFLDVENVPDLTTEEVEAIQAAGANLHKKVYRFGE